MWREDSRSHGFQKADLDVTFSFRKGTVGTDKKTKPLFP